MATEIPHRTFGKTGVMVSCLGLGGYHLGDAKSKREAIRIVQEAVDHGITFMDNAWEYHDGISEQWMGEGLKGRRDRVFLMTKVCTHGRNKKVAMKQLEESLRRLKTDYLDLWQVHEVIYDNDPDLHFSRGNVIEALDDAKQQGKVRFTGFTGHKHPEFLLKMLSHNYPFDACQFPLNCFDASFRSFEQRVLPELMSRGIAAIGMKSLGGDGDAIKRRAINVGDALRYAMSLPVATTVSGIDSLKVLRQNIKIASDFQPLHSSAMNRIRQQCLDFAADGRFELYKTSKTHDGPPGRKQHGFPSEKDLPL